MTGTSSPNSNVTNGSLSEDARRHLDYIQQTIGRMSSASIMVKSWALPVATATLGYALTKKAPSVALLGFTIILLFGYMDFRYLREERKFRALYEDARLGRVALYTMNTEPYITKTDVKYNPQCTPTCTLKSWSLLGFYGAMIIVGITVAIRAALA